MVRKEIVKGKVEIYSYLDDHNYNKFQKVLVEEFSGDPNVNFLKCSNRAVAIENADELNEQIALFHKNESGHSGIITTYGIYNPKLKEHMHQILTKNK